MTDTPRLLTMKPYEWEAVERTIDEHSALEPSYVDALHSEVLAQAARVQALEQSLGDSVTIGIQQEARIVALEQERERIRQALEEVIAKSQPPGIKGGQHAGTQRYSMVPSTRKELQRIAASIGPSLPPAGEREETLKRAKCRRCCDSGFVSYWDGSAYAGETCPDCTGGPEPASPQTKDETR